MSKFKVSGMSRDEKIEILIEDRFWEWIYARNTEGLEEYLRMGWKGFEHYTNEELEAALEDIDVQECKELIKSNARRGGRLKP